MPTRPAVIDALPKLAKQKQPTLNHAAPPSLLTTILSPPPPPLPPPHSCGNKCQVIVS
jgi:hypothetical protein